MGFHNRPITRGHYGDLSKIREELEEAEDAVEQGQTLMLLIELADIVGAAGGVAERHGLSLDALVAFAKLRSKVAREEEADRDQADLRDWLEEVAAAKPPAPPFPPYSPELQAYIDRIEAKPAPTPERKLPERMVPRYHHGD